MNTRNYGTSGYHPSHALRSQKKHPQKEHKPKPDWMKTAAKWVAGILGAILTITWLFLGDFSFMMTKFPSFTGFPFGSRTYIVIFQNNYELRPTGGFISTYGTLKFSHGVYSGIEFFDVYGEIDDHDYIEPPLVLATLLDDETYEGHTFRDANFDPDFTLTKDELIKFYQITNPDERIDGVIAADFTFLETLVGLYEPIYVEGYELTEDNLFETLSTAVSDIDRHNEEALAERKGITSPLVKAIIKKTVLLPWRIKTVLNVLYLGFEEKHVLASFERSGLMKAFAKRNWDGALPQSDAGDFLVVNDANYGGMKSNRYTTRDVKYELDVSDKTDVLGNPVINAKVTVTLSHEGIWNIPLSGMYTGFLRVMIPLGSEVILGSTISEDREDSYVLGELVEVEPGSEVTYTYEYELPEYVWTNDIYNLHLHKQPGTDADHYEVVVRVPQGKSLDSELFDVRENVGFFETNLLSDVNLSFKVLEDENPPHIVMHEITAFNEITLVFNEAMATDYAGDALNYEIVDMDYENSDVTDSIFIDNIIVDGAAIILQTKGMTTQDEERYEVNLRNLRDTNGNTIDPNPRTVTVIQRGIEINEKIEDTTDELTPDPETEDNG